MIDETNTIPSVEQPKQLDQLLTARGMTERFHPFRTDPVSGEHFFGKQEEIRDITSKLLGNGIVVLEGGYRGGKTSLMRETAERMRKDGQVSNVEFLDIQIYVRESPENIEKYLRHQISGSVKGKTVIAVDELKGYGVSNTERTLRLLDVLKGFRDEGHLVMISTIGDLRGDSQKELPKPVKTRLLSEAGDSIVVNQLLEDSEVRKLLSRGDQPLFTDSTVQYLIREAGGHPMLANYLAEVLWDLLHSVMRGDREIGQIFNDVKKESRSGFSVYFPQTVECVIGAGFNPLTWEYVGGGVQPDNEVYVNMLPRYTSTIFRDWLEGYMRRRGR